MIDPFGLRQEAESVGQPEAPDPAPATAGKSSSDPAVPGALSASGAMNRRRLWAVLLVLDTVFLFVFGGTLAGMMYLSGSPAKLWQQWFEAAPSLQKAVPNQVAAPGPLPAPPPAVPVSPQDKVAPPVPSVGNTPATAGESKHGLPAAPAVKTVSSATNVRKAIPVEFTCVAKSAKEVLLKGSFLVHMKGGQKKMKKSAGGTWHLKVLLFPGSYRYQCVTNGKKSAYKTIQVAL